MLKYYLAEAVDSSLLLSFLCSLLGISAASYYHHVNLFLSILVIIGAILAHISVNVIDDYVDFKVGIDKETIKTKFSGGTKLLVGKFVKPEKVLLMGMLSIVLGLIIGAYLTYINIWILPIIAVGVISTVLYTRYLTHLPLLAELLVALNFALISFGSFIIVNGSLANIYAVFFLFVPAGLQIGNILFVNEIPDRQVDRKHGRRSIVVLIDDKKLLAVAFAFFSMVSYALIVIGVALGVVPYLALAGLLTVFLAYIVARGIRNYKDPKSFERFMGMNVINSLLYLILLSAAYLLSVFAL